MQKTATTVIMLRRLILSSVLLTTFALRAAEDYERVSETFSFRGSYQYGAVEGFLQTPAGGEPGTSSSKRPTLKELDIDNAGFYDVAALVHWRRLGFYAGYEGIGLDGDSVLNETLISRGVTFPAGTSVHSKVDLNWLRAGVGWKFELANHRLELFPKADFALLDFSYKLNGGGEAVDRSYSKGCFRVGMEGKYRCFGPVSLRLDAEASVPISNTPQIAVFTGDVEFDLLRHSKRFHPTVFVGGGWQRIEYEDNQTLPNHIKADFGPFVRAGLGLSF